MISKILAVSKQLLNHYHWDAVCPLCSLRLGIKQLQPQN